MKDKTESKWWILQLQLPATNKKHMMSTPEPRKDIIQKAFSIIPEKIRIKRGSTTWGIANVSNQNNEKDIIIFYLTANPANSKIAEEQHPGYLQDSNNPRFFTMCALKVSSQLIIVNKDSDTSRYSRSANTYAYIFRELIEQAIIMLEMKYFFNVEVEAIAENGSFIEWINSQDLITKIIIKHTGSNLPAGASDLINEIKEAAKQWQKVSHAKNIELVANEPDLDENEIAELDQAIADRRLKLRARGLKSNISTTWCSSERPIPITLSLENAPEDNTKLIQQIFNTYPKK